FEAVPQDLIDAARNLGAGPLSLTGRVLIPLVAPGLFGGGVFTFIGSMEEFVLTFIVGSPDIRTLPVLLFAYLGWRSHIFTYAAVVTIVLLAPTILLLFLAERALKQEYLAAGLGKMLGLSIPPELLRSSRCAPHVCAHRCAYAVPLETTMADL